MIVERHPELMCKLVDVTRTKALDTSHGPICRPLIDKTVMIAHGTHVWGG